MAAIAEWRSGAWRAAVAAACLAAAAVQATPSADAAALVQRLREAAARPGGDDLADLTALPFLFEGRPHDREAFVRRVVPALFTPAVRRCLRRAEPQPEEDRWILWCAPYGFYLGEHEGRWRLIEFVADPP